MWEVIRCGSKREGGREKERGTRETDLEEKNEILSTYFSYVVPSTAILKKKKKKNVYACIERRGTEGGGEGGDEKEHECDSATCLSEQEEPLI